MVVATKFIKEEPMAKTRLVYLDVDVNYPVVGDETEQETIDRCADEITEILSNAMISATITPKEE
jgi:CRISPR/Cas system-associated exonuclease Cas4 (RecB family)